MNRICGFTFILVFLVLSAQAQECDSYLAKDFLIPSELEEISDIYGIASGENCFYYCGSEGIWRLDISSSFELQRSGHVELDVYSLSGRHVAQIAQGLMSSGSNAVYWDGTDTTGRVVGSGVYLISLETELGRTTSRVVVAK